MMNRSKCNKCGLVNPAVDVVCRRCGGILGVPVYNSLTEEKTKSHKYLLLAPFLLVALGSGYWYSQTKKSALDPTQIAQEEKPELTMDKKVNPEEPAAVTKPRDIFDQLPPERREAARQALQQDFRPAPIIPMSKEAMDENSRMQEQHQKNLDLRDRLLPPGSFRSGP